MSHPADTLPEASQGPPRRPSRVRAAFQALLGAPVVPVQIRAEWTAVQLELEAVCDKIAAATNRQITRDKRELKRALDRLEELEGDCGCNKASDPLLMPGGYSDAKRLLNRRVLASRGRDVASMFSNGGDSHVDGAEGEQG